MNFWLGLVLIESALAEFGLVAVSSSELINGAPVHIKNGHLVFGVAEEPLLQANFVNDTVVLSDKIVAESAVGAGIGPDADGLLSVISSPAHGFGKTNGFLAYNGDTLFSVKETSDFDWSLFVDWMNPKYRGIPVMLQVAELAYPAPVLIDIQHNIVEEDTSSQGPIIESESIQKTTSTAPAPATERPTLFSTVYETILVPRTETEPKTSTVTVYQEIIATFTTETVTASPTTSNASLAQPADPVNR